MERVQRGIVAGVLDPIACKILTSGIRFHNREVVRQDLMYRIQSKTYKTPSVEMATECVDNESIRTNGMFCREETKVGVRLFSVELP